MDATSQQNRGKKKNQFSCMKEDYIYNLKMKGGVKIQGEWGWKVY